MKPQLLLDLRLLVHDATEDGRWRTAQVAQQALDEINELYAFLNHVHDETISIQNRLDGLMQTVTSAQKISEALAKNRQAKISMLTLALQRLYDAYPRPYCTSTEYDDCAICQARKALGEALSDR